MIMTSEGIKKLHKLSNKQKAIKWKDNGFNEWGGYMAAKKLKLDEQFNNDKSVENCSDSSDIFYNVAIFVNGYTDPSADSLKRIMMCHGGAYHHYFKRGKTTHIIASNLAAVKIKDIGNDKIVTSKWITESLKEGKLLDYKKYLLYTGKSNDQKEITWTKTSANKEEQRSKINSNLYNDCKPQTTCTKDDNFLSEFYSNSRLHLISTMGSIFKKYVSNLENSELVGLNGLLHSKGVNPVVKHSNAVIMHIDMDCFFVSVSLRDKPNLLCKPVAVAHSKNTTLRNTRPGRDIEAELKCYNNNKSRSVSPDLFEEKTEAHHKISFDEMGSTSEIASCNYIARQYGLRNGMFLGLAREMCPDLIVVPYDFEGYKEVAFELYNTVASFTHNIEAVSCDEMFVDCSEILNQVDLTPLEFAEHLRSIVREKTGCTASAGMGPNMLIARLATKLAKPDGCYYVSSEESVEFMKRQQVADLPGIGRRMQEKLSTMTVNSCEDLERIPKETLRREFGMKTGDMLYNFCRGIDSRSLKTEHKRQSVSAEINYGIRFDNFSNAEKFLKELSEELSHRLKDCNMMAKCFTLKLKVRAKDAPIEPIKYMGHGACDSITRSINLTELTWDPDIIYSTAISMLKQLKVSASDLRGIGIQGTKLESPGKTKTRSLISMFQTVADKKDRLLGEGVQPRIEHPSIEPLPQTLRLDDCQPSTSRHITTSMEDPNLKPPSTDFDLQVWRELPEDVKKLIIAEYESIPAQKECSRPKTPPVEKEPTSFSQIDESFLRALPDDVRIELQENFTVNNTRPVNAALKKSPIIKKRRAGQLTKRSPLKKAAQNNMIISSDMKLKNPNALRDPIVTSHTVTSIPAIPEPDLNGMVSAEEVKTQLLSWVESTNKPLFEDVETLVGYLHDVIEYKNLELLQKVLKHFQRIVFKSSEDSWKSVFVSVMDSVQLKMNESYNANLALDDNMVQDYGL